MLQDVKNVKGPGQLYIDRVLFWILQMSILGYRHQYYLCLTGKTSCGAISKTYQNTQLLKPRNSSLGLEKKNAQWDPCLMRKEFQEFNTPLPPFVESLAASIKCSIMELVNKNFLFHFCLTFCISTFMRQMVRPCWLLLLDNHYLLIAVSIFWYSFLLLIPFVKTKDK